MILGLTIFGIDVYVPLYVQGGLGGGVGAAAWAVTPVMLNWALSGIIAAPLIVRWGFRKVAVVGSLLVLIGMSSLLACALTGAPRWVMTATLAITGFGFGPASMSYLLAAQHAVPWQRRGIVTSGIQYFRTSGGAIGIGLLGALFNLLIRPNLAHLQAEHVTPQALLDPVLRDRLPPTVLHSIGQTISGGLLWVFVAMVGFAVASVIVSSMMSAGKTEEPIGASEAMEAMAG
jgi:MFS family permease